MPGRLIALLLVSITTLFSAQLCAHAKVDTIRLVNGNEITGEIEGLQRGKLSYDTDSMGKVGINWEDVVAVVSGFRYEIRLADGRRFYGSMGLAENEGDVRIFQVEGQNTVRSAEIIELRAIEDTLNQRLNIRLGAGYSYTKASDVATFNLTSEFGYEDEKGISSLQGRTVRTDNAGEKIDSNRYTITREMWTVRPQVIRWFNGSYEDNEELDLDYRYAVGFGFGRAIFDTNDLSFVAYLGLQAATEKNKGGGDSAQCGGGTGSGLQHVAILYARVRPGAGFHPLSRYY